MVNLLLQFGADPNIRNDEGLFPLHYYLNINYSKSYLELNNLNIIKKLLEKGTQIYYFEKLDYIIDLRLMVLLLKFGVKSNYVYLSLYKNIFIDYDIETISTILKKGFKLKYFRFLLLNLITHEKYDNLRFLIKQKYYHNKIKKIKKINYNFKHILNL